MTNKDRFIELFNVKIRKFFAVSYLRFTYLLIILAVIFGIGIYEYLIARYFFDKNFVAKLGVGLLLPIAGILIIIIYRVIIEFFISIFYIENHLRAIREKNDTDSDLIPED